MFGIGYRCAVLCREWRRAKEIFPQLEAVLFCATFKLLNLISLNHAPHFLNNMEANQRANNNIKPAGFEDLAIPLLKHYNYYFTHPAHLHAQVQPLNAEELSMAQSDIPPRKALALQRHSSAGLKLAEPATHKGLTLTQLDDVIEEKMVRISRTLLATTVLLRKNKANGGVKKSYSS